MGVRLGTAIEALDSVAVMVGVNSSINDPGEGFALILDRVLGYKRIAVMIKAAPIKIRIKLDGIFCSGF